MQHKADTILDGKTWIFCRQSCPKTTEEDDGWFVAGEELPDNVMD